MLGTSKTFIISQFSFVITDREQFQLGSLSHYINTRAVGYHDLPTFPEVAPESNRGVNAPPEWCGTRKEMKRRGEVFYNSDSSPADGLLYIMLLSFKILYSSMKNFNDYIFSCFEKMKKVKKIQVIAMTALATVMTAAAIAPVAVKAPAAVRTLTAAVVAAVALALILALRYVNNFITFNYLICAVI